MLLPSEPQDTGEPGALGGDPRTELVRQLLQYKAFKDAAGDLTQAAADHALRFPRHPAFADDNQAGVDLDEVQVWDLLDAFSRMMAAIGKGKPLHEVIYDDTPVELHAADIMDRLKREGPMAFTRIFEGRTARGEIVGLFLALLELVRQKKIIAMQDSNFGTINITVNANAPPDERPADFATNPAAGPAPADTPPFDAPADAGALDSGAVAATFAATPSELPSPSSDDDEQDDDEEDDEDDNDEDDEFAELDEIDVPELDIDDAGERATGTPSVDSPVKDVPPPNSDGQKKD
jgi:segregation and condensation protein A